MMPDYAEKAAENLTAARKSAPLIHNITNFVVMNYTANALLALGVSPVMAHAPNEVADMVSLSGALVLNIGTLEDEWVESMIIAGRRAGEIGTPVVLDPVGSGATPLRTRAARKILESCRIHVIRGNASEILSLRDESSLTKGVDAAHSVADAEKPAARLAAELQTTLAVTGAVDLVTDGQRTLRVKNGHPLMGRVTGTGCTATALVGAFLAVDPDPFSAAATALAFFGLAGEIAAGKASAPGSFMIQLLDALFTLSPEQLREGCRIVA
jgi:hydroxyethylthiazole kinase